MFNRERNVEECAPIVLVQRVISFAILAASLLPAAFVATANL